MSDNTINDKPKRNQDEPSKENDFHITPNDFWRIMREGNPIGMRYLNSDIIIKFDKDIKEQLKKPLDINPYYTEFINIFAKDLYKMAADDFYEKASKRIHQVEKEVSKVKSSLEGLTFVVKKD